MNIPKTSWQKKMGEISGSNTGLYPRLAFTPTTRVGYYTAINEESNFLIEDNRTSPITRTWLPNTWKVRVQ